MCWWDVKPYSINQSAVNMTLLASAAVCRVVTSVATPLVVFARRSAANPPHVGTAVTRWDRQTDGQTQDSVIGSALYTVRAVSIIEQKPNDTISTVLYCIAAVALHDITTLYPPLPPTSHVVTPAWIPPHPSSVTSFMDVPAQVCASIVTD